jgi:hypothetical protein
MRATYFRILATLVATCVPGQRAAADSVAHATEKPALYLELWPTVRAGTGRARGPFVPDISLHGGDTIELMVRTSSEAQVYLLHCDTSGTLSIFPDAGGIPFHADQWVTLPASDVPIVLGASPGTETLYVVSTRDPLERSDPKLSALLARAANAPDTTCDEQLEALLVGNPVEPKAAGSTPFTVKPPPHKSRYALRGVDLSRPTSPIARAFAEQDGVVVLRLTYQNKL